MKILDFNRTDQVYSANAYLLLGIWNRINDVNTLIDTGADEFVAQEIGMMPTGVGKNPVEQVVLTHNHFDHSAGLSAVIERYQPRVYAWTPSDGVTHLLKDGEFIFMGDDYCQVIHTPGHSSDSICIYCPAQKILFSGDVPLSIRTPGSSYTEEFVEALERISRLDIRIIYSGHNPPIESGAQEMIKRTLENVRRSEIVVPVLQNKSP
ncbi:MAG TPA: MBL fold metallo-hydrolase [Bacteroidota bacterium]|nr:MBL fold metallo-hydrolase [Bacteroidota bacterium]